MLNRPHQCLPCASPVCAGSLPGESGRLAQEGADPSKVSVASATKKPCLNMEHPMKYQSLASVSIRHRMPHAALGVMLLLAPLCASAQGTLDDYRRAGTINQRFANLTTGLATAEGWIGQSNQAVYRVTVPGGSRFVRVDAEQWTKQPAFDHAAVARSLSTAASQQYTEITLPFVSISVVDNGAAFEGDASGSRYRCTIATSSCSRVGAATTAGGGQGGRGGGGGRGQGANAPRCGGESAAQPGAARTEVFSPDCRTVAFIQNYNVAVRPAPAPTPEGGGRGGRGGGGAGNSAPNYTSLSTDGSEGRRVSRLRPGAGIDQFIGLVRAGGPARTRMGRNARSLVHVARGEIRLGGWHGRLDPIGVCHARGSRRQHLVRVAGRAGSL